MYGITLGIVVQNNDPQKRGRVKVFIPHLSLNLYDKWDNNPNNKSFVDLSDPNIREVINEIKTRLPWANCAAPIVGEAGSDYFDAFNLETKSGDNVDRETDKPAQEIEDTPIEDHFGNKYSSSSYSNAAKGLFSVPKVGSKVYVFFEDNDLNRPVYFAISYNKSDWDQIEDNSGDYPEKLENLSKNETGEGYDLSYDSTYKNKLVVSQRGGVIEIINTDTKESIAITHFNGGYKIWDNSGTNELVKGDDKKHVTGGLQLHIGGNANIQVDGTCDITSNNDMTLESKTHMTLKAPRIDLNP